MVNKKILMCAVAVCTLSANHIYADETHVSMRDLLCPQTYIASVTTLPPVKQYNVLEDTESGIIVHTETRMYTTTAVNLRTKNTTKSKSVKLLKAGKAITVLDKSHHKWQKIFYKGKIRYINSKYLSKKKPAYTNVRSVTLHGLSEQQKQRAYTMAEICIKEWKKYGVLPSVCIAQAMQESTLALVEDLPSNYFDTDSVRDANTVLAAPDGVNGKASFRKLVAADIPALDYLPYKNKTISDEVYFANDVFWGNTKKNIQFVYDVDQKFISFDYFTSGGGGSASGTANFICNNLSGTEGVFRKDVKIPIYQMDDEGVETLIDTISLKSLYKFCNNLSVNNNTVTIEQFGQQTDSFTLNQNTDVTISLIHDDTKLDVAGGEVSGDLYVAGTLGLGNASEYTYIDYNDNEVSFNKVNNISGKVLGVRGDYFKTANVSVGDDVMLNEYGEMNDEGERPLKRTISLSDLCNRIEKIEAALENLGYMDSNIVSQAISTALDENN